MRARRRSQKRNDIRDNVQNPDAKTRGVLILRTSSRQFFESNNKTPGQE